ncbi:hypothetical protein D3C81_1023680 [compost metagenome]
MAHHSGNIFRGAAQQRFFTYRLSGNGSTIRRDKDSSRQCGVLPMTKVLRLSPVRLLGTATVVGGDNHQSIFT